jgi:hypothetical protein
MKNFRIKSYLLGVFIAALSSWGCEKETLKTYEGESAINFDIISGAGLVSGYSTDYTFLVNPNPEHILEINTSVMGLAADEDRFFNVEVVSDSNTTAKPSDYEIIEGIVPAGEFKGKLRIKLKKTDELLTKTLSLRVRLVDSEDFKVGNPESRYFTINWTNRATPPAINVYVRTFIITAWSTKAYSIFTQTTGRLNILAADYGSLGEAGVIALGTKFGDYIKQWNLDNPNDILKHDDGTLVGQEIKPVNYTRSKYD